MSLEIRRNKQILSACGHTDSMKKDEYISSPGKRTKPKNTLVAHVPQSKSRGSKRRTL